MSEIKSKHKKKLIRGIVIFAVCTVALQALALAFVTPGGLAALYPYILSWNAEEITTGDNTVSEYLSMNDDIKDAGLIVLGADINIADSYRLATDFMRYISKFTSVTSVALYTQQVRVVGISDGIISGDYQKYTEAVDAQKKTGALNDQIYSFLNSVYTMNSRLSDDNKFTISGIKGYDKFENIKNDLMTELYLTPGGTNGEHTEMFYAKSGEEYARLFRKHEGVLSEILGSRFEFHKERCSYVEEDAVEENFALNNLARFAPAGEGTVFAIVPEKLCADGSVFLKKAEEIYGKVVAVKTVYYDCKTLGDEGEITRNDGDFPSYASEGIMVASANDLKGFRSYYEKVVNSFSSEKLADRMDVIGDAGKRTFFIIVGSEAVTYKEAEEETKTVGTVNVAPG